MMTQLYRIIETNKSETINQNIEKVDILFDLKGNLYELGISKSVTQIVCACGHCDLQMEKEGFSETVSLNNPNKTVQIDKEVYTKLKNFSKDIKLVVMRMKD